LTTPGDAATATIDQSEFGTVGATEWTTVTVDVNEMMNAKPALDYSKIDVPFKLVQNGGTADLHIQIKDIQFTKADFEATAPTTGLFTVFDNAIKANWTAWKDSGSTDAVLALDDDTTYGNVVEFTIDGNHVVGFSTRSDHGASSGLPHNASENTALEFDLKISTMPAAGVVDWKLKLESPGAASALELNLTDSIEGEAPELDVWKHFTFSIANLETRGLDIENIDVIMIFPAWGSGADAVFSVDNVKFTNTEVVPPPASAPATAAPSPTEDEANVISIFSDAYTDVAGTNFNPSWGQSTVSTQVDVAGNNTLKYANLNYQGTEFTAQDVSAKTSVHVDFWTADATDLQLFLISPGPVETAYSLSITQDEWVSIDIPLSNFTGVDLADVFQFKVVGNGTVFLDNLYFH
jgi:hypothetical protein